MDVTSTWSSANVPLSTLTGSITSSTVPVSPVSPMSHPEVTIAVVLGLSLLLAGVAAFLAACRPSEQDEDCEVSCGYHGDALTRKGRRRRGGGSTEPQLKVWRRLGSYRRSYHTSFRRPRPRRTPERESMSRTAPGQTPTVDAGVEPSAATPCLFDYVTEI